MKELSIEAKAARYDKAIEVATDIKAGTATYITDGTTVIDAIFPELKMPNDETIRQALIKFHKDTISIYGIEGADIVNWLEKQNTFTVEDKRIYESIIKDACDKSLALTERQREWLKTKIKM